MSSESVCTGGYQPAGSMYLVTSFGYVLGGQAPEPPPPDIAPIPKFGGGPFTQKYGYGKAWDAYRASTTSVYDDIDISEERVEKAERIEHVKPLDKIVLQDPVYLLRVENLELKAENKALRDENTALKAQIDEEDLMKVLLLSE